MQTMVLGVDLSSFPTLKLCKGQGACPVGPTQLSVKLKSQASDTF